jgi:predicted transposase YbfD/YdcC
MLRGASSVAAIGEAAAELDQDVLARLDAHQSPTTGHYRAPCTKTFRRTLKKIDSNAFDKIVGALLAEQSGGQVDTSRPALAVDGKSLRGSRLDGGQRTHLLSVLVHATGATVAQRGVGEKANEITEFVPLLEDVDLRDVVVTADALHTQKRHATYLIGRGGHYIFALKKNQESLLEQARALLEGVTVSYEASGRGHGRVEERRVRVADLPAGSELEGAAQVVAVDRERHTLHGWLLSRDTSFYITSLAAKDANAQQIAEHIRAHWGIENRSHWVRDYAFDEDRCTVRKGSTPQVLACLRNLAVSLLRLAGHTNVTKGLRWAGWDVNRPLGLLGV